MSKYGGMDQGYGEMGQKVIEGEMSRVTGYEQGEKWLNITHGET